MPLVMVRPNWPSSRFQRTVRKKVQKGKKTEIEVGRTLVFTNAAPTEVTSEELAALASDIGNALFEVELDGKNRPRYVESATEEVKPDVENVSG